MAKITENTTIFEALEINPNAGEILMQYGMHCLGCPHATAESLEDACAVHGTNVDELVHQINEYLAEKKG